MTVSEDVLAAMRKTNELFNTQVIQQQQFDALDHVYTSDARVLPPGAEMVSGREAIKVFWRQAVNGLGVKSAQLTTVEADLCGDGVVEIGKADLALVNGQQLAVKYVVFWKQEQRLWKWAVDIWNTNS
ncbi:MAG TPA: nuclear transport factor 2 family protein [Bryobacteraceae bacterium]